MFFLLVLLFIVGSGVNAGPILALPNGKIEGISTTTLRNKVPFYAYLGIPYAEPAVGKLRFQAPRPASTWKGIFNATSNSKVCYQITQRTVHGQTEDCLTINVYTTAKPGDNPQLPVMVGIYGGSFTHGFASAGYYGPQHIIEQGVLVVTFNYRVGPFGFLSTKDGVISGNMGLKDQLLALQWVQKNILLFGGDPKKVTIYGQSAGAASVTYHILSKKSAGLFRAAISSSGSALCEWACQKNPLTQAYGVAAAINASFTKQKSTKELLEFLQSVPAESVHQTQNKYSAWAPVLETNHEGAFITDSMYQLVKNGKFNKVPLLSGINSEEELSHIANLASWRNVMKIDDLHPDRLVPRDMNIGNMSTLKDVGIAIKKMYTNGSSFEENLGKGIQYMSDNVFNRANLKYAELQSHFTDVYFYQFSYHGKMGGNSNSYPGIGKVQHGEEGRYFWASNIDLKTYPKSDVLTVDRFVGLLTNFIKHLTPTPTKNELFDNITWPKVKNSNFQYLDIDAKLTIKENPREGRFKAWEDLFDKYAAPPYITY